MHSVAAYLQPLIGDIPLCTGSCRPLLRAVDSSSDLFTCLIQYHMRASDIQGVATNLSVPEVQFSSGQFRWRINVTSVNVMRTTFWITRNWSHIATHLVVVRVVLVRATSSKTPIRLRRFKFDRDEIRHDWSWRHFTQHLPGACAAASTSSGYTIAFFSDESEFCVRSYLYTKIWKNWKK